MFGASIRTLLLLADKQIKETHEHHHASCTYFHSPYRLHAEDCALLSAAAAPVCCTAPEQLPDGVAAARVMQAVSRLCTKAAAGAARQEARAFLKHSSLLSLLCAA